MYHDNILQCNVMNYDATNPTRRVCIQVLNFISICMENHDESMIKLQVHDSSKTELLEEIRDLRKRVNKIEYHNGKPAAKKRKITFKSIIDFKEVDFHPDRKRKYHNS